LNSDVRKNYDMAMVFRAGPGSVDDDHLHILFLKSGKPVLADLDNDDLLQRREGLVMGVSAKAHLNRSLILSFAFARSAEVLAYPPDGQAIKERSSLYDTWGSTG